MTVRLRDAAQKLREAVEGGASESDVIQMLHALAAQPEAPIRAAGEDDRPLVTRIVQALPEQPPTAYAGWARYKNECADFVDRLRAALPNEPVAQPEAPTTPNCATDCRYVCQQPDGFGSCGKPRVRPEAPTPSAEPVDRMISYTHVTGGHRFRQRLADPLPGWAYDVREEMPAAPAAGERTLLYPEQDHMALGDYYLRHVDAMTSEGLHAKSDIAAQLAGRDREIDRLSNGWRAKNVSTLETALATLTQEPARQEVSDDLCDRAVAQAKHQTALAYGHADASHLNCDLDDLPSLGRNIARAAIALARASQSAEAGVSDEQLLQHVASNWNNNEEVYEFGRAEMVNVLRAAGRASQSAEAGVSATLERARFEAWASDNLYSVSYVLNAVGDDDGPVYKDSRTHAAWWAWQARATRGAD